MDYSVFLTKTVRRTVAGCALIGICAGMQAQITFDGNITEPEWQSALATSAGGPGPGFGASHEINAVYAVQDAANIYLAVAGNVINGNRILVFFDTQSGGFTNGSFSRTNAPQGIDDFNGGNDFDDGFLPDYCLVIGTNAGQTNYFFDLFTLAATGSNNYLGDANTAGDGLAANPANSTTTQGFELTIPKTALGNPGANWQMMLMYTSDGGFLSNQFLTRANPGEGNYGNGVVIFDAAAPNPLSVTPVTLPATLLGFAGRYVPGEVSLAWTVASELHVDRYEILRRTADEPFQLVGAVPASQAPAYSFSDLTVSSDINRYVYQLRIVDIDGQTGYSDQVELTLTDRAVTSLVLYPNPATDQVWVTRYGPASRVRYALLDLQGREIRQWVQEDNISALSLASVAPGMYVLRAWVDGRVITQPLTVR
ncbi:MAG: T9SS type A sorting domain-containing protein [Bacteroidia bacterium]|nr:T9SS type A sorting domain-containing protein [Bacteroidia bacterium]